MRTAFGWRHLLLALAVGAAAGAAAGLHGARWAFGRRHAMPSTARMVERFGTELTLTAEQKAKLAPVLERARARFVALHGEVRPKFEAIRRDTEAAIVTLLTPEQAVRFKAMEEKRRSRRPPPGPGPVEP